MFGSFFVTHPYPIEYLNVCSKIQFQVSSAKSNTKAIEAQLNALHGSRSILKLKTKYYVSFMHFID
ncbi:hypothetical protein B1J93_02410 [Leptospira kirschneri serovar Pomona]|uniref:Uncharacterized protein n=1 Tax=Leptospira kirschneri serovar Pomona TaxID=561005 RepID=A0A1T1E1I6_9LEPT|nr:hypothetical protein B1J93_02410 [Leptospira kirschneri serovar Pomona]